MYTRRPGKLQAPDKNQYTVYNPHSIDLSKRETGDVVKVISIDPGIRNLALRVETRGITSNNYPIKTIVFEKLRITEEDRRLEGNNDQLYFLMTQFLDKYREIFKTCDFVLIERQMAINYKAVRISQHIITYFLILFKDRMPLLPVVYEVDPKLKGRELGASKHLNERGIKQWSVDYAKALFTKRQDYDALKIVQKNKSKSDDLCDCACQLEAFFSFQGWPLTPDKYPEPKPALKLNITKAPEATASLPPLPKKLTLNIIKN
jgi:hypothetical protein